MTATVETGQDEYGEETEPGRLFLCVQYPYLSCSSMSLVLLPGARGVVAREIFRLEFPCVVLMTERRALER